MTPMQLWTAAGLTLVGFAAVLASSSSQFDYALEVADMPVWQLALGLSVAGVLFVVALPTLLLRSQQLDPRVARQVLGLVFAAGLAARLILMASTPALEDDSYRYLWDGAVVAHGLNPYVYAPAVIAKGAAPAAYTQLWSEAGIITKRINHKDVTTIYPPVAQAAFALSYLVKPWSLNAWRGLLVMFDIATFALLVMALDALGRSRLWTAVYWWNPVVLKELFNSAHLEPLMFPFLLGALLFVRARKPVSASAALAMAAGLKLWPVILLPLILRPFVHQPKRAAAAALVFAGLMTVILAPVLSAGLSETTGLGAYASNWHRNGALFSIVQNLTQRLSALLNIGDESSANTIARALMAATAGLIALAMAWRPVDGFQDLVFRALVVTAALVFLSPAGYPWYTLWFLPFLVLVPEPGLLLLSATIPLYYLFFHFAARDTPEMFSHGVIWLIWLPPLAALAWRHLWLKSETASLGGAPQ